jgi:hypothetical protein
MGFHKLGTPTVGLLLQQFKDGANSIVLIH